MTKTVLIVGRTPSVNEDVLARVHLPEIRLISGSTIDEVRAAFNSNSIDHVILGGGIELEQRLEIVRAIFHLSSSTTVHMNSPSGPESYLPFIQSVLNGIKDL